MNKVASSVEFNNALLRQGAALSLTLPEDGAFHPRFGGYADWPSSIVDGVDLAGIKLRENPNAALVEPPVAVDVRQLPQDHLSQALGAMINASVLPPEKRLPTSVPYFVSEDIGWGACAETEPRFLRALKAVLFFNATGCSRPNIFGKEGEENGVRIVVDPNGAPIFLQKANGNPLAMALRGIDLGVPHPKGSIVGLKFADATQDTMPKSGLHVVRSEDVKSVGFRRTSSFVVPGEQRVQYDDSYGLLPYDRWALRWLSVDRIARSVATAVTIARIKAGIADVLLGSDRLAPGRPSS